MAAKHSKTGRQDHHGPTPVKTTYHAFRLPDGSYLGRLSFHDELGPQPAERALPFSARGAAARKVELLAKFPGARIVPDPNLN